MELLLAVAPLVVTLVALTGLHRAAASTWAGLLPGAEGFLLRRIGALVLVALTIVMLLLPIVAR